MFLLMYSYIMLERDLLIFWSLLVGVSLAKEMARFTIQYQCFIHQDNPRFSGPQVSGWRQPGLVASECVRANQ